MGAHGDGDPFGKKWNIGIIGIVHPMVNYCNSLQLKMVIFHSYVSVYQRVSIHRIGLRENLQEPTVFSHKMWGCFFDRFSLKPIHWIKDHGSLSLEICQRTVLLGFETTTMREWKKPEFYITHRMGLKLDGNCLLSRIPFAPTLFLDGTSGFWNLTELVLYELQ